MTTVLSDFEARVLEIERYFELLNLLISKEAELHFRNNRQPQTFTVDAELSKILRANCFLILYNLAESSIRQSILEIHDQISSKQLKFQEVKDEIKKVWLNNKYKNFKTTSNEDILIAITNIANDMIDIRFDESGTNLGGNVDAQKIREFARKLGFSDKTHHKLNNGSKLHIVKNRRNHLAHGNISFANCGREYSIEDLEKIKNQVVKYLRNVLKNIKKFIDEEQFKNS
ncbi:MAG: hypothetical protein EOO46_16450 [Flavobacterium sp.]|nr:MAG: hypothetical protein EOO46_16450 [Flavobacterium sp.]